MKLQDVDFWLVLSPMAAFTRIAFSNASLVRIFDSFKSSRTISTARMPDICASTYRRASTAGMAALCGSEVPTALFAAADALLYQAKHAGRNRVLWRGANAAADATSTALLAAGSAP